MESSRGAPSFSETTSVAPNSARVCDKCIAQNKFGRPLALLNEVYERQMEQKLSPVQQRKAHRNHQQQTDSKLYPSNHPGARSQSVHHTRYFNRDA